MLYHSFDNFPRAQHNYKSDQLLLQLINISEVQANKNPADQTEASEYSHYTENTNQNNQSHNSELTKMNDKFYNAYLGTRYGFTALERLQPKYKNETNERDQGLSTSIRHVCVRPPRINRFYASIFTTMLCQRRDSVIKL